MLMFFFDALFGYILQTSSEPLALCILYIVQYASASFDGLTGGLLDA